MGLDRHTGTNRADQNPKINPNPEASTSTYQGGMVRTNPITPFVNPNPEEQGSGGVGNGARVVGGPGYGQIDPSSDSDDGDQQGPTSPSS